MDPTLINVSENKHYLVGTTERSGVKKVWIFIDIYEVQGPQVLNLNLENIYLEDHKNIFFVKINP